MTKAAFDLSEWEICEAICQPLLGPRIKVLRIKMYKQ